MASGDTKTETLLNILGHGGTVDGITGSGNTKTQDYLVDAIGRIQGIEDEVEELKNNPDVVDIVDTYADLQAYDTQHLTENDIIRVLQDETHDNNSTYYRFTKNPDTWTFIGEISGGGGGGGSVTYYLSVTPLVERNGVTVYSDIDCTTPISLKTYFSSLRSGKTVWIQYRAGSSEDDNLYSYQIVSATLTNVDTQEAYNEIEPFGAFFDTNGTMRRLGTFELDPDATVGAFRLA